MEAKGLQPRDARNDRETRDTRVLEMIGYYGPISLVNDIGRQVRLFLPDVIGTPRPYVIHREPHHSNCQLHHTRAPDLQHSIKKRITGPIQERYCVVGCAAGQDGRSSHHGGLLYAPRNRGKHRV